MVSHIGKFCARLGLGASRTAPRQSFVPDVVRSSVALGPAFSAVTADTNSRNSGGGAATDDGPLLAEETGTLPYFFKI